MKIQKECQIEKVASQDESRYAITEAYLDMGGDRPLLVATNGMAMAIIPVETNEHDKAGPVSSDALKAARKARQEITCNGSLSVTDGPQFPRRQDVQYPNWRQVVPDEKRESKYQIGINVRELWVLCQAMGCETVRLEFADNTDAVVVVPTTIRNAKPAANLEARGVIMPVRLA